MPAWIKVTMDAKKNALYNSLLCSCSHKGRGIFATLAGVRVASLKTALPVEYIGILGHSLVVLTDCPVVRMRVRQTC